MDYILVDQREKSTVSDVTVIRNEPCLLQHKLLVCHLVVKEWVPKRKRTFVSKTRIHKLGEVSVRQEFQKRVSEKASNRSADPADVDGIWKELKSCLIDTAKEVCGESKKPSIYSTWWWNDECVKAVEKKNNIFDVMNESKEE